MAVLSSVLKEAFLRQRKFVGLSAAWAFYRSASTQAEASSRSPQEIA
jgi:hypothetical protein